MDAELAAKWDDFVAHSDERAMAIVEQLRDDLQPWNFEESLYNGGKGVHGGLEAARQILTLAEQLVQALTPPPSPPPVPPDQVVVR